MVLLQNVQVMGVMVVQVIRNFILCGLMVIVACEAALSLTLSVLKLMGIVIQVQQIFLSWERVVKTTIAPIPCGMTDVKHVCVLMPAIPLGVMALEVIIMISTLRNMERVHGVIPM